jgi:hypothetical protein
MSHHHEFNRFIPYIIFLLRVIAVIYRPVASKPTQPSRQSDKMSAPL